MKHNMLVVLASVFLIAGAVQAQAVGLVVEIPFDFVAYNTTMHAGTYTINPIDMRGSALLLRRSDLKEAIVINPCLCASEKGGHESKLVFHAYGNQYFLSQIWTQGYDVGRQLPRSRREIEEARSAEPQQVAMVAGPVRAR
jgi:hypothetical protein